MAVCQKTCHQRWLESGVVRKYACQCLVEPAFDHCWERITSDKILGLIMIIAYRFRAFWLYLWKHPYMINKRSNVQPTSTALWTRWACWFQMFSLVWIRSLPFWFKWNSCIMCLTARKRHSVAKTHCLVELSSFFDWWRCMSFHDTTTKMPRKQRSRIP